MTTRFGSAELPLEQLEALHRARRLEWGTLAFLAVAITAVFLVMGNSQAMKTAWAEDLLSLAPPIAFLVAVRLVSRPPTPKYPYGLHRAVGVGHLVAAVALLLMGAFLVVDAGTGLVTAEHPPIGTMTLFGATFWAGWAMVVVMALTIPLPIVFGRKKMKLADQLHDKVLYADADMNKAGSRKRELGCATRATSSTRRRSSCRATAAPRRSRSSSRRARRARRSTGNCTT